MKYFIKNEQDLDTLLAERCVQKQEIDSAWVWESERGHEEHFGCDAIVLNAKGKWFDQKIVTRLNIFEGSVVQCIPVTKIQPEDQLKVKNTILYIQENFDHIYQTMLERLLPSIIEWGVRDEDTDELITTIEQFHKTRWSREIAGMEAESIRCIQLNCKYQKDDMVVYSLIFNAGYVDDGFEVVFWKDRVLFFLDGNTEEQIFDFVNYVDWPDCLE